MSVFVSQPLWRTTTSQLRGGLSFRLTSQTTMMRPKTINTSRICRSRIRGSCDHRLHVNRGAAPSQSCYEQPRDDQAKGEVHEISSHRDGSERHNT